MLKIIPEICVTTVIKLAQILNTCSAIITANIPAKKTRTGIEGQGWSCNQLDCLPLDYRAARRLKS